MTTTRPGARGHDLPRHRFTPYALLYFLGLVVVPVFATALALDGLLYWMAGRVIQGCYSVFCLF